MNILMYSHDTFGLGHIRRTLALAQHIKSCSHNIIILTGSPIVGRFTFPMGIDFVRVPGMIKHANDLYLPHSIRVDPKVALAIRRDIILATAKAFQPDVFLIDKAPLGLGKEVVPTLRWLHKYRPTAHVVLGLRDVMDSGEATIAEWRRKKIYQTLENLYSEIWVYGNQELFDPIEEYEIPPKVAKKVYFTGYIPRKMPLSKRRSTLRKQLHITEDKPFVLVTTGGGGDGYKVIDTYLTMMERHPKQPHQTMIVAGPLLAEDMYDKLAVRARKLKLQIVKFHRKMEKLMVAADCVIAMGGYNTSCELISSARPALIIPRSTPRQEQIIRARIFADKGLIEFIPWEDISPENMAQGLAKLLKKAGKYEKRLRSFPMTAYDVINNRINSFEKHNG